jgi:hypothetical protein
VSSSIDSVPVEIQLEIIRVITNTFDKSYRQSNVYNLMRTCKSLYATCLPYLYVDVRLQNSKSYSFFVALPEKGQFVRRLRIDQEDRTSALSGRHNHIITGDRLLTVARYCTNLRHLFLGYNCEEHEYLNYEPNDWFSQFLKKTSVTLESLILPTGYCKNNTIEYFYGPLEKLTRLYIARATDLSRSFVDIGRYCSQLRGVYLFDVRSVSIDDILAFFDFVPALETLHLQSVSFVSDDHHEGDEDCIGVVLANLPKSSRHLKALVFHQVELPEIVPAITPDSFPKLRVLDMVDEARSFPLRITQLSDFLRNLKALEILHLDFSMIEGLQRIKLLDNILSTVEVYTCCQVDEIEPAIADAVRDGKLKNSFGVSVEEWAGLEVDEFVKDWECNMSERRK